MCVKVLKEQRKVCISLAGKAGVTIDHQRLIVLFYKHRDNFKTMACHFIL